jgi:transposase InsO family protein
MNHKKILRIMRKYHLVARIRRKNPYRFGTMGSLEHRISANKLNRAFKQRVPFTTFCTDVTYLPFKGRLAYLSVIKDIASGEIVAWDLKQNLGMDLVTDTLRKLRDNTQIPSLHSALIHSDQGFHYTNSLYAHVVDAMRMERSMSRRGNCLDNAPIESFFGHLKDDVDYRGCNTFQELHGLIEAYMRHYNTGRPQWGLKKMTPVSYT